MLSAVRRRDEEMKRHSSFDDIKNDPRFRPDNPVDQLNYQKLDSWYAFKEGEEIHCCVRKENGNRCKKLHRLGWVPELKDGTITIIGGTCARKKFGANSNVSRDIAIAQKAIDRNENLARLATQRERSQEKHEELHKAYDKASTLKTHLATFRTKLGEPAWARLVGMSRTGNSFVRVLGVVDAKRDAKGAIVRTRQNTLITVGRFVNLEICRPYSIEQTLQALRDVATALMIKDEALEKATDKELKSWLTKLEEYPRVLQTANELDDLGRGFLSNDFTLLAFTTANQSERVRLMGFGLAELEKRTDTEYCRAQLRSWDARLESEHKVERLEIG